MSPSGAEETGTGGRRELTRQAVRYLAVGLANTVISYAVFVALGLVLPSWLAYTIAYAIGLAWVLFGTSRLVFRSRSPGRIAAFGLWYLFLYGCGQLVIALLRPSGLPALVVTSLVLIAVTTPLAFLGGRLLFAERAAANPGSRASG